MSLYNINNKLICGSYGFITACENYTPPPSSYILRLNINGGSSTANMVWNLTPNALSGRQWEPWFGTQVPQSGVDAINSTNQNNAYIYANYDIYWHLGETYSPVSFKYKTTDNTWRSLTAELYFAEEQGSSALLDSKTYQYYTGATIPVTITLQSN